MEKRIDSLVFLFLSPITEKSTLRFHPRRLKNKFIVLERIIRFLPKDAKLITSIWLYARSLNCSFKNPAEDCDSTVEISIFLEVTKIDALHLGLRATFVSPRIFARFEWGIWSISASIEVGGTSKSVSLNNLWIAAETINSRWVPEYVKRLKQLFILRKCHL